jgi:hypothetical protein
MPVLVGIKEVLVRLRERGPQSTTAIAEEFDLNPLDARILLLDAHLHGLVIRNDWGEWAISQRGREAISVGARHSIDSSRPISVRARRRADFWRRAPSRAVLVGASAVMCGLGAGVAIGFMNSGGGAAGAPANEQAGAFAPGHRFGRHVRHGSHGSISSGRRFYTQVGIGRELHLRSRPLARVSAPVVIYGPRTGHGVATAAAAQTTVRMALGREALGSGTSPCTAAAATKSTHHRTGTRQRSSGSRCSRQTRPPSSSRSR